MKTIKHLFFSFIVFISFVTSLNAQSIIAHEDIYAWVGEGSDAAVLVVDFLEPDVPAYAWGVRFDNSITGKEMLELVAEKDGRFNVVFVFDGAFLGDITYLSHSGLFGEPNYFGTWTWNEDEQKWDSNSGIGAEITANGYFGCSYTDFDPALAPGEAIAAKPYYSPAAGQAGSIAIHKDNDLFVNWATGAEVTRGYLDIAQPELVVSGSVYASHGVATNATGKATGSSVVSLGDGGYAILTFEKPIENGEGYDFAVFENGFADNFLELAFVEVSSDGENFYRFPSASFTQTDTQIGGFGALDPTYLNNLAGNFRANFGTPFDLEELIDVDGLDVMSITHVKIIDVIGTINPDYATYDSYGNIINDPYSTPFASGGFDLDAVGVINQKVISAMDETNYTTAGVYPNPTTGNVTVSFSQISGNNVVIEAYGIASPLAKVLYNGYLSAGKQSMNIATDTLEQGMYIIKIQAGDQQLVTRLQVL